MVYCDLISRESTWMWTPPSILERYYQTHPLLVQVDFEVFGGVHGVYFTKYARDMTNVLGIRGWIRLTRWGTVFGQIQGEKDKVDEMALWLRLQGSPGARIERTEFKNWQIVDGYTYRNFTVRF